MFKFVTRCNKHQGNLAVLVLEDHHYQTKSFFGIKWRSRDWNAIFSELDKVKDQIGMEYVVQQHVPYVVAKFINPRPTWAEDVVWLSQLCTATRNVSLPTVVNHKRLDCYPK